jgi:hypothetical protein
MDAIYGDDGELIYGETEVHTHLDTSELEAAFRGGQREVMSIGMSNIPKDWNVAIINGQPAVACLQLILTDVKIPESIQGGDLHYTWRVRITPSPPEMAARFFAENKQVSDATEVAAPMITLNIAQAVLHLAHQLSKTRPIVQSTVVLRYAITIDNEHKIDGWASSLALWEITRDHALKNNERRWEALKGQFWPVPQLFLLCVVTMPLFFIGLPLRLNEETFEKFMALRQWCRDRFRDFILKTPIAPKGLQEVPHVPEQDPWLPGGDTHGYIAEVMASAHDIMDRVWRSVWMGDHSRAQLLKSHGYNLAQVRATVVAPSMFADNIGVMLTRRPKPEEAKELRQQHKSGLPGYNPELLDQASGRTPNLALMKDED